MIQRLKPGVRPASALVGMVTALGLVTAPSALSAPPSSPPQNDQQATRAPKDDRPNPMADRQNSLRKAAVDALLKGEATTKTVNGKRVIALSGKDKKGKKRERYVQYDPNQQAQILSFLVDFGTKTAPAAGGQPGPVHNSIAEPDRTMNGDATDDNSTIWTKDFNRQHYLDMMFGAKESFKDFYAKQSNGRFVANGDVSEWVTVPYNEARYGHNPVPGDGTSEAEMSSAFIADSATAWVEAQKKAGKSDADIKAYLSKYDVWDRYDHDGDGNFNEPDGYIDHFQAIHAGEGEEAGGGDQGEDAIWSHRWYAKQDGVGTSGPESNKRGGVPLGSTGLWIGDYTTEPENGGLGVFAHEFGHDLGLPDLYDTTSRASNDVSYWSLMSSGSWLGDGRQDIGSKPGYLGPWEKLQLGWLDATSVPYGKSQKIALGPSDRDSAKLGQAAVIGLPDQEITTAYNTPKSGASEWWGGSDDNLETTLSRRVDLTGKKSATLNAAAWYDIEPDFDFLHVEVSGDGGTTWKEIASPITGSKKEWTSLSFDLSPYAGRAVDVRFRYTTDGGVHLGGPFLDDISVVADGETVFSDGAENGDNGWTAKGFTRSNGSNTVTKSHYYLAENRQYNGYDQYLRTGPYTFGFLNTQPNRVEHLPFQTGMLVWYVNNAYEDNNVSSHPGHGLVLPVDSHPTAMRWSDGKVVSNQLQPWDATFSRHPVPALTLHRNGTPTTFPKQKGVSTFDDSSPTAYYDAANPTGGVMTAGSRVRLTVSGETANRMNLDVRFAR